jgi:activator of HSP90 ATPase
MLQGEVTMALTIKQKVAFNLPPAKLFRFYMDPDLHSELIGSKAVVSSEAGSKFSAFAGDLKGKMLHVKKNQLIVQTWRGSDWDKEDLDSILIFVFREAGKGTELEMIHFNVPEEHAEAIRQGWKDYYWKPWKAHIRTQR